MGERLKSGDRVFIVTGYTYSYLNGKRATVGWETVTEPQLVFVTLDEEPREMPRLYRRADSGHYVRPYEVRRIVRERRGDTCER